MHHILKILCYKLAVNLLDHFSGLKMWLSNYISLQYGLE